MNRIYAKSFRRFLRITRGTFYANSVLTTGLALPLAVVPTTTLQNGVAVSALVGAVTVPVALVGTLLRRTRWRVPVCMVVAALCLLVFTSSFVGDPAVLEGIGTYLPLVAANTLLLEVAYRPRRTIGGAVFDSVRFCLGFTIAACAVGAVREILSLRTIWSEPVEILSFRLTGASWPFFGFLLLGFLGALFRGVENALTNGLLALGGVSKEAGGDE